MKHMSNDKGSIQELILNMLSKKRAMKTDEVTLYVESCIDTEERKVKPRYVINRAIKQMVDKNMITQYDTEQSSFLSLAKEGRHKLRNIRLSSKNHLIPTTWDGYWRMVIVDIPESRKSERDAVRYILKKAQFVQLKSSVWISPFPLEHMMINMKEDLSLDEELIVIVTNTLDPGTELLLQKRFTKKED